GTDAGVTAMQMDIKIEGITSEIMVQALSQAKEGRVFILGKMAETLTEHRKEMSQFAPKMEMLKISVDKIKDVIGPGGKHIKGIIEETGAKIDIEDDGSVRIFANCDEVLKRTIELVREYAADVEEGKIYKGIVKKITDFGAFVEILPRTDGLLHISQISNRRIERVEDVLNQGDTVTVRVIAVDHSGKIKLSMKNIDQDPRDNP
ncbi:MAG TPA: S1 RNA-binding domain-containing protein, partial [bacterium]|nr:S1 RNA-binding domain-containing protein [bacterium]